MDTVKMCVVIMFCMIERLHCFNHTLTSQVEEISRFLTIKQPETNKKYLKQKERSGLLIEKLMKTQIPEFIQVVAGSKVQHNAQGQAVFACAISPNFIKSDAAMFVGSLRETGYKGDIVVAVSSDARLGFLETLTELNAIIYKVSVVCKGSDSDQVCKFTGIGSEDLSSVYVSINMLRYHLYVNWSKLYQPNALILVSDFADVFFQSNPFEYKTSEWAPPVAQLVVFLEAYPNKLIYRCPFNGGWIRNCYGEAAVQKIGHKGVSCSGTTIGSRDALLIYSYMMVQQLEPQIRYSEKALSQTTAKTNNDGCISLGMDQGFHNWLIHSGKLDKYMDVKIYLQGEGPVNTVGAFYGENALIKLSLTEWGILKGGNNNFNSNRQKRQKQQEQPPYSQSIYNWNGEVSPLVHQLDRFMGGKDTGILQDYSNLVAFQPLKKYGY